MPITGKVKTMYEDAEKTKAIFPRTHAKAVTDLIDTIYPVGSIYMSVNSVSPETLFGGTWEQIQDTFLLASGSTYSAGSTGGEAKHTLTVDEIPEHTHNLYTTTEGTSAVWQPGGAQRYRYDVGLKTNSDTYINETEIRGGSQPHNNMPPYLAVYMWKRTA